jgi:hypothetical protein
LTGWVLASNQPTVRDGRRICQGITPRAYLYEEVILEWSLGFLACQQRGKHIIRLMLSRAASTQPNPKGGEVMKLVRIFALILVILVAVNFMACGGGSKTDVKAETSTTTLGQELMDLEKAYKDGVITEKEYKKAREAIIKKKTK